MSAARWFKYRLCGLIAETDLGLPGFTAIDGEAGGEAPADIRIERGKVDMEAHGVAAPLGRGLLWCAREEAIHLEVPGLVRFRIEAGRKIVYDAADGKTPADFAVFLMASALGALLHQRNAFVLHGSAVEVDGRAVLFCGASGAGKSSLAAALTGAGYPLVADDICAIRLDEGAPALFSDGRALRLWAETLDHLPMAAGEPVRRGIEKYWVEPPASTARRAGAGLPVGAIYFLREARPGSAEPGLEPLTMLAAAEMLRMTAYRPRLLAVLRQDAQWLQQSLQLLSHTQAFLFTRPRRFECMNESIARLQSQWHGETREAARHAAA